MKISLEWLSDFVELQEKNIAEIVSRLTECSAEVDGVEDLKSVFDKIIIGEILEIEKHPDADKLQVAKVVADQERSIVCGANNIKVGQKIPVAVEGARIGDFVIEKRKLRGVMSEGMLCSERELGLSDDHEGIMILPNEAPVGESFADYMGFCDQILDVDNTAITNRPDMFAHYGFARELVAIACGTWQGGQEKYLENLEQLQTPKHKMSYDLKIKDKGICPRWCGITVENVQVRPAPDFVQRRLRNCGIRPINNIVDATNYVMLELGMPMHAFDSDKLHGKKLLMRRAKKGESMYTLDDKKHNLPEGAIIMEDEQEIFDLCGLMGGASSAVSDDTQNLLIHAPVYDAVSIRRTALALNHRTDAATIYEKGVPVSVAKAGLVRTINLILQTCPEAKITSDICDIQEQKPEKRSLFLSKNTVERVLGTKISNREIEKILQSLSFELEQKQDGFEVLVPSFRLGDVYSSEDLVEEVVRIYGFNRIEAAAPMMLMDKNKLNSQKVLIRDLTQKLVSFGFYEVLNLSFSSPNLLKRCGLKQTKVDIEIQNPLSIEQSLMRASVLPKLLETAEKNARFQDVFSVFECGRVFYLEKGEKVEKMELCALILGKDFLYAKGVVEALGFDFKFKKSGQGGQRADIYLGKQKMGVLYSLASKLTKEFSLSSEAFVFSLDIDLLSSVPLKTKKYQALPKYPSISFDISFLAPFDFEVDEALRVINKAKNIGLLVGSEITEVFTGEGVPENQKSITLSFELRADDRTLEEKEAKIAESQIIKILTEKGLQKRFSN